MSMLRFNNWSQSFPKLSDCPHSQICLSVTSRMISQRIFYLINIANNVNSFCLWHLHSTRMKPLLSNNLRNLCSIMFHFFSVPLCIMLRTKMLEWHFWPYRSTYLVNTRVNRQAKDEKPSSSVHTISNISIRRHGAVLCQMLRNVYSYIQWIISLWLSSVPDA